MVAKKNSALVAETCKKFLDAAEEIYIQHGYYGTSIRAIAKLADRNLGTLHHYWGNKQALFKELFELRFTPLQEQHTQHFLKLKEKQKIEGFVNLKDVTRILVEPFYTEAQPLTTDKNLHRLYSRVFNDTAEETSDVMGIIFEKPLAIFIELLRDACPSELSPDEFRMRINFAFSAVNHQEGFNFDTRLSKFIAPNIISDENKVDAIINFLVAGLSAPPSF